MVYVIPPAQRQRIREAIKLLQSKPEDVAEAETVIDLAEAILRRSASDDGIRAAVSRAVRSKLKASPDSYSLYPYVRDIFHTTETAGTCVYEVSDTTYSAPFTITADADGDYTADIGEATEVDVAYVPMADTREGVAPVQLTGEYSELLERAVQKDGTTQIKIIQEGWGSSGYYPSDVLKRDGPRVFPAGHRMFWNHPTKTMDRELPERDLRDLAAVLQEDATWQPNGPKGPGLYAKAKVLPGYQKAVEELAPYMGVSIRGVGLTEDGEAAGRKGKIVKSLVHSKSVDFVTAAGAGGEVLSLFESARETAYDYGNLPANNNPPPVPDPGPLREGGSEHMPLTPEEETRLIQKFTEAVKPLIEASSAAATTALARINEAQQLQEARTFAAGELRGVRLPEQTKARIVESIALNPPLKDGVIDREAYTATIKEAAKAEARYISSITGGSDIYGAGGEENLFESANGAAVMDDEKYGAALTEAFSAFGMPEKQAAQAARGR